MPSSVLPRSLFAAFAAGRALPMAASPTGAGFVRPPPEASDRFVLACRELEEQLLPLQAVEPRRLYRQIAEQIAQLIASGEFLPGSRLPAERELAASLGVSRASVREAIISLEIGGLVEVRVGTGIFVAATAAPRGSATDEGPGPFELLDARASWSKGKSRRWPRSAASHPTSTRCGKACARWKPASGISRCAKRSTASFTC
jgi:biotin operon repressor